MISATSAQCVLMQTITKTGGLYVLEGEKYYNVIYSPYGTMKKRGMDQMLNRIKLRVIIMPKAFCMQLMCSFRCVHLDVFI